MSNSLTMELLRRIDALERRIGDVAGAERPGLGGTPVALGAAAAPGSSLSAARADHVHPRPTAAEVGALSTGGGTLTGDVVMREGFSRTIRRENNAGRLSLFGGTTFSDGAYLDFNGNAAGSGQGGDGVFVIGNVVGAKFVVYAYDGTTWNTRLIVYHDGRVFMPSLRVAPASPGAGEIYVDSNGFLKRG